MGALSAARAYRAAPRPLVSRMRLAQLVVRSVLARCALRMSSCSSDVMGWSNTIPRGGAVSAQVAGLSRRVVGRRRLALVWHAAQVKPSRWLIGCLVSGLLVSRGW